MATQWIMLMNWFSRRLGDQYTLIMKVALKNERTPSPPPSVDKCDEKAQRLNDKTVWQVYSIRCTLTTV